MSVFIPPKEFELMFTAAGWSGDSRIVDKTYRDNHVGWDVLESYNGIHVYPKSSAGLECASGDIHFQWVRPICKQVEKWQTLLNTRFMSVAVTHRQYSVLWIATDGAVFASNDITDVFGFVGPDITVAIRNELSGIRNQPLMRDDESTLSYYGDNYNRGDSRLFDWHIYAAKNGG